MNMFTTWTYFIEPILDYLEAQKITRKLQPWHSEDDDGDISWAVCSPDAVAIEDWSPCIQEGLKVATALDE